MLIHSRSRKHITELVSAGVLATAISLLFPKIYNSIAQPKRVIDTRPRLHTLAVIASGDMMFEYITDTAHIPYNCHYVINV